MESSFYSEDELIKLGFAKIGTNVLISKKASIYGIKNIKIGSNVRVDDFCVLSGNIELGNYVHIATATLLFGGSIGIELEDYTAISSRSALYAESDDYTGVAMTNPMVPDKYRNILQGRICLKKHSIVGTACTIMPGVILEEGTAIGAMSLVNKSTEPWGIYFGIPCKRMRDRNSDALDLSLDFEKNQLYQV